MADEPKKKPDPKGVIAIVTDSEGRVIATHADFDRSGYGGFQTWEAQAIRATDVVKFAVINAYASPELTKAINSYTADNIFNELRRQGHRLTLRAIGWPEDAADQVAQRGD